METVIITAGGIGKRMKANLPKQFLCIAGKPILMHTIERFYDYNPSIQILLTLPKDWVTFWEELQNKHQFTVDHQIVEGGLERFHSIQNALKCVSGNIVGVHDGVRPLVSISTIKACFLEAKQNASAVPFLQMNESMRMLGLGDSKSVIRKDFIRVQTPQVFEKSLLIKAYQQEFHIGITDDASLVEQLGVHIHLVPGNEENIKITTPNDLKIAELFI